MVVDPRCRVSSSDPKLVRGIPHALDSDAVLCFSFLFVQLQLLSCLLKCCVQIKEKAPSLPLKKIDPYTKNFVYRNLHNN